MINFYQGFFLGYIVGELMVGMLVLIVLGIGSMEKIIKWLEE
jgi:hypothetical protein